MRHHFRNAALLATALSIPALSTSNAQERRQVETRSGTIARPAMVGDLLWTRAADRAVLGVTLGAASRADTAGIRIEEVDANGPAAKAGIKAGDILTDINGVSLRVSPADAEDLALAGLAQRRLQRAMAKAKPGDEVDLRVRSAGTSKTLKLKTVSAAELDGNRVRAATPRVRTDDDETSGAIGISIGGSGSSRDTLGLFVNSVVGGGPAEKAGVIEGERIAAVNGIDVRVPKEDIEDASATSARVNRFVREVRKIKPGSSVSLRVYSGGRYRDVSVTAVKMSELPNSGWQMSIGDGGLRILRGGNIPGAASTRMMMTPGGEMIQRMPSGGTITIPRSSGGRIRMNGSINGEPFDIDGEEIERVMERVRDRMKDLGRDLKIELKDIPKTKSDEIVRVKTVSKKALTSA